MASRQIRSLQELPVCVFFGRSAQYMRTLAAASPDFIFEAIKKEQEGTLLFYLEAAEALSLSPVEFFHASNFSMKFAAPVLLGAARGRDERNREKVGSGGIRGYRDMRYDPSGGRCSADDDQVRRCLAPCERSETTDVWGRAEAPDKITAIYSCGS